MRTWAVVWTLLEVDDVSLLGCAVGSWRRLCRDIPGQQLLDATDRMVGDAGQVFQRLLPRLGYKSAIWAIDDRLWRVVWKILHEGVRFIEQGSEADLQLRKHRARSLARLKEEEHESDSNLRSDLIHVRPDAGPAKETAYSCAKDVCS